MRFGVWIAGLIAFAVLAACGGGGGGREVDIVVQADGCSPEQLSARPGERLTFVVTNESDTDREVEGIDGMRLEEVLVPAGRTRRLDYTTPGEAGTQKIKCYLPAGPTTIIELDVSGEPTGPAAAGEQEEDEAPGAYTDAEPTDTVDVTLASYAVSPDKAVVAAGAIRFVAHNASSTDVHELAVLRLREDGGRENMGEIEDVEPDAGGEVVLDLPPGRYELACLIAPGEAGSAVDHYTQGMHTPFTVE